MATYRSMAIDPASGRVFVAGDDKVVAFAPDGTLASTITGLPGASGIDFSGGFMWVAESTTQAVAKIDLSTLAVVTTFALHTAVGTNIVVDSSAIWIGDTTTSAGVKRFSLANSSVVSFGSFYGPKVARIAGDPGHLLVVETGITFTPVHRVSTSAPYA